MFLLRAHGLERRALGGDLLLILRALQGHRAGERRSLFGERVAFLRHELVELLPLRRHQHLELGALGDQLSTLDALLLEDVGPDALLFFFAHEEWIGHPNEREVRRDVFCGVLLALVQQLGRLVAQFLRKIRAQLGLRRPLAADRIDVTREHRDRERGDRSGIVCGGVDLLYARDWPGAERNANAIGLGFQMDAIGGDIAVHDLLVATPFEQCVDLTKNRRNARVGERFALGELFRERRIVHALRDDGKGLVAEPAAVEHRNEPAMGDAGEDLGIGGEVRQCVSLVAFGCGDDGDEHVRIVVAALGGGIGILALGDVGTSVAWTVQLAEDRVVGFEGGKVEGRLGVAHKTPERDYGTVQPYICVISAAALLVA